MLFSILIPGMSYSSNTTPLALSSATSAATSLTAQNAVLAFDVPHPLMGTRTPRSRSHTRRSGLPCTLLWASVLPSLHRTSGLERHRLPECKERFVHSSTSDPSSKLEAVNNNETQQQCEDSQHPAVPSTAPPKTRSWTQAIVFVKASQSGP